MSVLQVSVFLENKPGQLSEVVTLLADRGIDLRALSLADTQDFGILRLIVDAPDRAAEIIREAGYVCKQNHVLCVAVPDQPGSMAEFLKVLASGSVSLEYTYAFTSARPGCAYMVCRVDDRDAAEALLSKAGYALADEKDLF